MNNKFSVEPPTSLFNKNWIYSTKNIECAADVIGMNVYTFLSDVKVLANNVEDLLDFIKLRKLTDYEETEIEYIEQQITKHTNIIQNLTNTLCIQYNRANTWYENVYPTSNSTDTQLLLDVYE